jgi:hypothetical protein
MPLPGVLANRISVLAYKAGGQSISSNSATRLTDWTTELDAAGAFNSALGQFTAPKAATYLISVQIQMIQAAASSVDYCALSVRGGAATVKEACVMMWVVDNMRPPPNSLVTLVPLNFGQSIWFELYHNTGITQSVVANGSRNFLSIVEC